MSTPVQIDSEWRSDLAARANAYATKAEAHLDEETLRNPRGIDLAPRLTADADAETLLDWLSVLDPHATHDFPDENDTDSLWNEVLSFLEGAE